MKGRTWAFVAIGVGVWVLLAVVVLTAVVTSLRGGSRWEERHVRGTGPQKVVIVPVEGVISSGRSGGGLLSGTAAGADDITAQLRQALQDDDVAAAILRVDSPGGDVVASDEIYRAVRRLDRRKPVVASMGSMAASGGYYISAATRRIVANPATLTGSIGVILTIPNLSEAASKVGIKPVVLKSGKFKDAGSSFRDLTSEEAALFQRVIDEAYEQFLAAVARGREKPVDEIRPVADGRVLTGLQAEQGGLVDVTGDLERAYREALRLAKLDESESRLVRYEPRASLGNFLAPSFRSPVKQMRDELGLGFGLKYLYLP